MSTTACARFSEGYPGLVGIVTTRWQRSSASLGRPLSSRPNSSATGPARACARISAAASRGRCRFRFAVRPRAVKPITCTQSASASSSRSNRATRATASCVWCAIPSMRYASYSRGVTSRRSRKPKFFIARTTCAMLTRSWGSWRTTTIIAGGIERGTRRVERGTARRDRPRQDACPDVPPSAFHVPRFPFASSHQLQYPEPLPLLPVPAQPHPPVSSAPDQLAGSPQPARQHFIDQQIERQPASHVRAVPPPPPPPPRPPRPAAPPAPPPRPPPPTASRPRPTRPPAPPAPPHAPPPSPRRPQ